MSETAAKYPVLFAVIGIAFLVFAIFLSVGIFVRSNEINRAVDKNVTVNGTVTRVWTTKSRRKISKHNYNRKVCPPPLRRRVPYIRSVGVKISH